MRTSSIRLLRVLSTLLFLPMACAVAPPAGQRAATDWKQATPPVANVVEPALEREPAKTPTVGVPASRDLVQLSPPVATLPESASPLVDDKPKTEAPRVVEAPPVIDEAQLSRERARAAILLLENTSTSVRAAVCSARSLLAPIPEAHRQEPVVVDAQKRLKSKEPGALREEQAEFEPNRMYLCRDNTPSPTCYCNGPKRGCCSHHKGVAGCEPLPTEITCP